MELDNGIIVKTILKSGRTLEREICYKTGGEIP